VGKACKEYQRQSNGFLLRSVMARKKCGRGKEPHRSRRSDAIVLGVMCKYDLPSSEGPSEKRDDLTVKLQRGCRKINVEGVKGLGR